MLDPATLSQGGGVGDTPLYSNLKLIAVPVLATILHTAPLTVLAKMQTYWDSTWATKDDVIKKKQIEKGPYSFTSENY